MSAADELAPSLRAWALMRSAREMEGDLAARLVELRRAYRADISTAYAAGFAEGARLGASAGRGRKEGS